MTEEGSHAWEGRFAALEQGQAELQRDLSTLTTDVARSVQATESLTLSLRTISDNQTTNARTNWGVVLTGLIVVVMVLGLVVYEPLGTLRDLVRTHLIDGHPSSVITRIDTSNLVLSDGVKRNDEEIHLIQEMISELSITEKGTSERLLGIERQLYPNASYRSGRPIGLPLEK